jgi:hypothetical protein
MARSRTEAPHDTGERDDLHLIDHYELVRDQSARAQTILDHGGDQASALGVALRIHRFLVSLAVVRANTIAAARDLGPVQWRAFREVSFPLVRGGIISSFVFSFQLIRTMLCPERSSKDRK